jgi:serine/threonine protein kinase
MVRTHLAMKHLLLSTEPHSLCGPQQASGWGPESPPSTQTFRAYASCYTWTDRDGSKRAQHWMHLIAHCGCLYIRDFVGKEIILLMYAYAPHCPVSLCASLHTDAGDGSQPADGALVGTPCFMSPELLGCKGYGFKTDVW